MESPGITYRTDTLKQPAKQLGGADSKNSLFNQARFDSRLESAVSQNEMKTESQVLMERRKEHEAKQAIKHKKDFIEYMVQVLTKPAAVKESSMPPADVKAILPLDEQDERDPTSEEIGNHVINSLW